MSKFPRCGKDEYEDRRQIERGVELILSLLQPNPLSTSVSFMENTMNPTQAGQTQVFRFHTHPQRPVQP